MHHIISVIIFNAIKLLHLIVITINNKQPENTINIGTSRISKIYYFIRRNTKLTHQIIVTYALIDSIKDVDLLKNIIKNLRN